MTDPELNAAVAEHVAKLHPKDSICRYGAGIYPDYVNDPAAVLELLHQEGGGWSADDQWMTPPNSEPVRYAVCIGKSRGFGPTFHRAAVRALLRAHGVPGAYDRD